MQNALGYRRKFMFQKTHTGTLKHILDSWGQLALRARSTTTERRYSFSQEDPRFGCSPSIPLASMRVFPTLRHKYAFVPFSLPKDCDTPRPEATARCQRVITRMDTSKSGWTPYVYYTTLYSTPRYANVKKSGNQSKTQLCKEKSWIQGLAPKYSD